MSIDLESFNFSQIINYFDEKASQFGDSPEGSDWNSATSQDLRITRLLRGFQTQNLGDLADVGAGFGRARELLSAQNYSFEYTGYEVAEIPLLAAKRVFPDVSFKLIKSFDDVGHHDRMILSGVFNLKLDVSEDIWEIYVLESLQHLYQKARFGISVNFLSSYSDLNLRRQSLYYADPLKFFHFVKSNISSHVKLDHSYGLWDFTLHIEREIQGL
ncbi:hypothetical protein MCEBALA9_01387 [Candidatus Nanopelagicaceae bacterium]